MYDTLRGSRFSTDFIFLHFVNAFVTSDIAFTLYLDYNLHSLTRKLFSGDCFSKLLARGFSPLAPFALPILSS